MKDLHKNVYCVLSKFSNQRFINRLMKRTRYQDTIARQYRFPAPAHCAETLQFPYQEILRLRACVKAKAINSSTYNCEAFQIYSHNWLFPEPQNLVRFSATQKKTLEASFRMLTLILATGSGWNDPPPVRFLPKAMEWDSHFYETVQTPWAFDATEYITIHLLPPLPVLRGRFGSNVHVTGFATTSIVRMWSKNINFTDVTFLNVRDWKW